MTTLVKTQSCPYCGTDVDDSHAEWEEGTHTIECDRCHQEYSVTTEYEFLGWDIEKVCHGCGEIESECYCDEPQLTKESDPQ
ncbi:hypothetical protein [Paenibacillus sp. P46E]|uniref:hypothetical protein n=1 Tax=Paenibacillus sp. P46E TaxID=1349436 RepID=UPI00093EA815|nr:hypothetical protein [Paenibacillus sp. P46E]OKP95079.1 hypothetical protein A3849_27750 [Paenibacillus sp. P46E]